MSFLATTLYQGSPPIDAGICSVASGEPTPQSQGVAEHSPTLPGLGW